MTKRAVCIRAFFWGMAVSVCATAVDGVLGHYAPSLWLRIVLVLLPLLPFAVAVNVIGRLLAESDELERQIAREAMGFALCGLAGLMLCTDLLRTSGVLPDFGWDFRWFITALWLLVTIGSIRSARRYR
jgi:hypothetical protein